MTYAPTKKKIVFSDEIKSHHSFIDVMEVIKACGDPSFKSWLINEAPVIANRESLATADGEVFRGELIDISNNLSELVGRQAQVDEGVIHDCKAFFRETPEWDVISLLAKVTGFLLNIQRFEKQIALIESNIESGVVAKQADQKPLTRDGQAPSYIPRSRQPRTSYRK